MNVGKFADTASCSSSIEHELSIVNNTSTIGVTTWVIRSSWTAASTGGAAADGYWGSSCCGWYSSRHATSPSTANPRIHRIVTLLSRRARPISRYPPPAPPTTGGHEDRQEPGARAAAAAAAPAAAVVGGRRVVAGVAGALRLLGRTPER